MATAPTVTSAAASRAALAAIPPSSGTPQSYARILNDMVVEVVATTGDITKMFNTKSQTWINCTSTPGVAQGWLYENGTFTSPAVADAAQIAAASAAQTLAEYKFKARQALAKSDTTMLRVQEAIVLGESSATAADVVAWMHYRRALRAIVTAASPDVTVAIPTAPAYPAGT